MVPAFLTKRKMAASSLLGDGLKFEEVNEAVHKSLTRSLHDIRNRDIRVGDKKLGVLESSSPPEQVITMSVLKNRLKDFTVEIWMIYLGVAQAFVRSFTPAC